MVYAGRGRRPNIVATVNSLEAIKRSVAGGLGVSVLSQVAVKKDAGANYLVFRMADVAIEREFYLVTNKNVTLSPAAVRFRDFVLGRFGG